MAATSNHSAAVRASHPAPPQAAVPRDPHLRHRRRLRLQHFGVPAPVTELSPRSRQSQSAWLRRCSRSRREHRERGAEPSRASARVDPLRRAFRASLDFGKCRCAVLRGFRLLDPANPVLITLILTNRDEQSLIPRHRGHGGLISGAWAESPLIPMHGTTPP